MTVRPKIFVIGHNKCGTTSLHHLFQKSQIRSVHWKWQGKFVAVMMLNNQAMGRSILHGLDHFDAFSDVNFFTRHILLEWSFLYRELFAAFPDAYYIYNTRDVDNWVLSRMRHNSGILFNKFKAANSATDDEVLEGWKKMFLKHKTDVRAFFDSVPRFIEFDIEKDSVALLKNHMSEHYQIDGQEWHHRNKSRVA